jgi:hypothetical protein
MNLQSISAQPAEARQQAAAAQADAAAAREAATMAREQARAHTQMLRDQAQMIRDAERMQREIGTSVIAVPPMSHDSPSPRQEKMIFAGFVILVIAAVVIFQPIMRALARRLEGRGSAPASIDTGSADRLQRIEQAVDAMAIEIERISEGQRFTTKLLSARAEAPVSLEG